MCLCVCIQDLIASLLTNNCIHIPFGSPHKSVVCKLYTLIILVHTSCFINFDLQMPIMYNIFLYISTPASFTSYITLSPPCANYTYLSLPLPFVWSHSHRTAICLSDLEDAVLVPGQEVGGDLLDNRHGCPAYVAPEMLQPGSYSGRAADMWSAGVILYTLLVGHYPFYDAKAPNLFMKIRSGHYQIPDHISYLARSLICSLLNYDPGMRPSAEAVASHPWVSNPPTSVEFVYTSHLKYADVDQTVPTHKLL